MSETAEKTVQLSKHIKEYVNGVVSEELKHLKAGIPFVKRMDIDAQYDVLEDTDIAYVSKENISNINPNNILFVNIDFGEGNAFNPSFQSITRDYITLTFSKSIFELFGFEESGNCTLIIYYQ